MLHSSHHAFQHVSVCDNLQGTWAAFRVALHPLVCTSTHMPVARRLAPSRGGFPPGRGAPS